MGGITFANIVLALLGNLIYVSLRLQKDVVNYRKGSGKRKKGTKDFLKFWWEENQFKIYPSILMITVLLYFAPTFIEDWMGCHVHADSHLFKVYSVLVGYATYSIWFQFINNAKGLFQKDIKS